jgi:hypothetical protein
MHNAQCTMHSVQCTAYLLYKYKQRCGALVDFTVYTFIVRILEFESKVVFVSQSLPPPPIDLWLYCPEWKSQLQGAGAGGLTHFPPESSASLHDSYTHRIFGYLNRKNMSIWLRFTKLGSDNSWWRQRPLACLWLLVSPFVNINTTFFSGTSWFYKNLKIKTLICWKRLWLINRNSPPRLNVFFVTSLVNVIFCF